MGVQGYSMKGCPPELMAQSPSIPVAPRPQAHNPALHPVPTLPTFPSHCDCVFCHPGIPFSFSYRARYLFLVSILALHGKMLVIPARFPWYPALCRAGVRAGEPQSSPAAPEEEVRKTPLSGWLEQTKRNTVDSVIEGCDKSSIAETVTRIVPDSAPRHKKN